MLKFDDSHSPSVIFAKADGKISADDFEYGKNYIEDKIDKYKTVRLLLDVEDVDFPDLKFFMDDLKFIIENHSAIKKFAVIGDKTWEKIWFTLMTTIFFLKSKLFMPHERKVAEEWILNE
ncbi:STAS/SEC14 domain-containing protein [Lentisphaerota bacterium ZTH]|nr:STAS/SEC14 domain-containing protein [Lentisphaerota bacterium]WET05865.1 STAS/SEC14 domain-containing protein [Lentisphaerota bacterium ZTH]